MLRLMILKTLSYGTMHMCVAIIVAYVLSGDWKIALAIGLIEPCIQTVAFFFHEKSWHHFEHKHHRTDHHNAMIDSVSPAGRAIDGLLHSQQEKDRES